VSNVTVFGAGAMGTALAMHLARRGHRTKLWASEFDRAVVQALFHERRHPSLPEYLPEALTVLPPEDVGAAAEGMDIAVLGAHSGGARTLARIVMKGCGSLPLVVGVAKGLEPESRKRMSEVYAEEVGHRRVISVGGPCLASEVAQGLPTASVFASHDVGTAEEGAAAFRSGTYHVTVTDDLAGVEYCTVAKNVAAIGMGILDGLGKVSGREYQNAKAALFTRAFGELAELVVAAGGRRDTVSGLAGLGDTLVTTIGGRNRLYGELLGEGAEPEAALKGLMERGMTVEGVDSARDVRHLAEGLGVTLPFLEQMHRILFEASPADSVLECLRE
jgi:glycerol-3-phosphate dehydrogenase (NAD(P)+)